SLPVERTPTVIEAGVPDDELQLIVSESQVVKTELPFRHHDRNIRPEHGEQMLILRLPADLGGGLLDPADKIVVLVDDGVVAAGEDRPVLGGPVTDPSVGERFFELLDRR